MLDIPDVPSGRALNRRQWLQVGGLGTIGLTLPLLLRASETGREGPIRSCVLFLLHGGPSQLDTWDMKLDGPAGIRGEFRPIETSSPGVRITEMLPLLARQAHRFRIVRSMTHSALNHNAATYWFPAEDLAGRGGSASGGHRPPGSSTPASPRPGSVPPNMG